MILYPPYIEGQLPAQVGGTLKIPFEYNRATGPDEVKGKWAWAKISTIKNNDTFFLKTNAIAQNEITFSDVPVEENTTSSDETSNEEDILSEENTMSNDETSSEEDTPSEEVQPEAYKLKIGQFYKIQIGFSEKVEMQPYYYSTAGVFKYTAPGELECKRSDPYYEVSGKYTPPTVDSLEKEIEYKFEIYKGNENLVDSSDWLLVESSGWLLHKENEKDQYIIKRRMLFDDDNVYSGIKYYIKTINNLINYTFVEFQTIKSTLSDEIPNSLNSDYDNGVITISRGEEDDKSFLLFREDVNNNFVVLGEFKKEFKDYTVLQGETYNYYAYPEGGAPYDWENYGTITADFEDMFLTDSKRTYKILYNPKVSSFKTTILESKLDTIGGQYPFFFRNGRTAYKEFPISGLISVLAESNVAAETRRQTAAKDDALTSYPTNLTGQSIYNERKYKLELLDWLNNGEVKLFRSPTEGNYLVRLMNVSLTPNDTLGRMIHTFNATAYEVAELSYENLQKFGLVVNGQ